MSSELTAAISSISILTNMAKTMIQAHNQFERNRIYGEFTETIIGLHDRILKAQQQMQELLNAKAAAEEKLKAYDHWEVERTKYALEELDRGVFVYSLKAEHAESEPTHWICPKCYQDRKKSILQAEKRRESLFDRMHCPECGADFHTKRFSAES